MPIQALQQLSADKPAHWYHPDGRPCHTVTGSSTGKPRPTTIIDARKLGLLPSVTSILKVWPKPGLDVWKRQQDLLAALTLPRIEGESDDDFCKRVIEDSAKHAETAADFGTAIHFIFESMLNGKTPVVLGPLEKWVPYIKEWIDNVVIGVEWTEKVLVPSQAHHLAYAGRCDAKVNVNLSGSFPAIIDIKTQAVKNGKPNFYDSFPQQLAAYSELDGEDCLCATVLIDSTNPSPPIIKVWDKDELDSGYGDFLCCYELFKRVNKYNP